MLKFWVRSHKQSMCISVGLPLSFRCSQQGLLAWALSHGDPAPLFAFQSSLGWLQVRTACAALCGVKITAGNWNKAYLGSVSLFRQGLLKSAFLTCDSQVRIPTLLSVSDQGLKKWLFHAFSNHTVNNSYNPTTPWAFTSPASWYSNMSREQRSNNRLLFL